MCCVSTQIVCKICQLISWQPPKEILFLECKWKDLNEKDANEILADLQKKSGFVQWNNDVRKDYFGLTAKKVKSKEQLCKKGFVVFDLDDM